MIGWIDGGTSKAFGLFPAIYSCLVRLSRDATEEFYGRVNNNLVLRKCRSWEHKRIRVSQGLMKF